MIVDFTSGAQKIKLPVNYMKLSRAKRMAVREQYIDDQKGKCYWCEAPLINDPPKEITDKKITWSKFPRGFLNYPVHLQHDHITGLTEGAVHAYCNAVLWEYHGR